MAFEDQGRRFVVASLTTKRLDGGIDGFGGRHRGTRLAAPAPGVGRLGYAPAVSRRAALPVLLASIGCASSGVPTPAEAPTPVASVHAVQEPEPEATPASPAYDGPPKRVLVELFSSQGCNSCPAADAFIGTFPERGWTRDQVIPLTFHVTYWDDLGWSDPYAEALYDQRQIGYAQQAAAARAADENTIRGPYTPQMVVDGRVHFSGALAEVARAEIERARQAPTPIELEVTASAKDTGVQVMVLSRLAAGAELDTDRAKVGVFAALAQRALATEVPRGENAGATLQEHWVVRDFAGPKLFRSGREHNESALSLELPTDAPAREGYEVVVFAQDLSTLAILAVEATEITG